VEADALHVVVDPKIIIDVDPGRAPGRLRVVGDNGATNWVDWVLYAGVRAAVELRAGANVALASLAVRSDTVVSASVIADMLSGAHMMATGSPASAVQAPVGVISQQLMSIIPEPYIITGNRAERMPEHSSLSISFAGQSENYSSTAGLEDALEHELTAGDPGHLIPADARWLPDVERVVAREDIGAGLLTWVPSQGSASMWWEMYADSAPEVDPGFTYTARGGVMSKPAMVMNGSSWLRLNTTIAAGPSFSCAMVMRLHESKTSAQLLTTYQDSPLQGINPLAMSQEGDSFALYAPAFGGRLITKPLKGLGRPVIIAFSTNGSYCWTVVADHTPGGYYHKHTTLPAARLYIGRPPVVIPTAPSEGMMNGEILDLAIWNSTLTGTHLWQVASRLDAIYGVTR
jgi:hypothetical protein